MGTLLPLHKRWAEHPQIFGPCLLRPNGWMNEAGTWHGGRPQPRRLCVRWRPSPLPPERGGAPSPISAHVYCGQTAGWVKMALGMEVGLGPGHIVLDGAPAPLPQKGVDLQFSAHFYCRKTAGMRWMHQDATWYGGRPQPRGLCVRWGPSPLPKKGANPQFSASVYCGQTAGWMKTPLCTEVDLGLGHIVLGGVPALRERGTAATPLFGPCLLWPWSSISATAELLLKQSMMLCR